jgi:metal-responsive CopG/Arc/MetJ family transcriptional regulator
MLPKPELIATLQVGMAASGECSACHEVFVVKGSSSKPEPLTDRLRQIFEEHVRSAELSKKTISSNGNLD